jgi:acetyl esterase/lipase
VLVGYRLAPETPYAGAPDDAEAAARWVASSPPALGREVNALVLGGDSAGGTLTIVTAMALRDGPAAALVTAGVPTTFREPRGNIHAFVLLRRAIPSSQHDIAAALDGLGAAIRP